MNLPVRYGSLDGPPPSSSVPDDTLRLQLTNPRLLQIQHNLRIICRSLQNGITTYWALPGPRSVRPYPPSFSISPHIVQVQLQISPRHCKSANQGFCEQTNWLKPNEQQDLFFLAPSLGSVSDRPFISEILYVYAWHK